jgi:hypothetical protein
VAFTGPNIPTSHASSHENGGSDEIAIDASQVAGGTLPVARGGTGLSALGTANQVLRVNAGATALEFADASGGGVPLSAAYPPPNTLTSAKYRPIFDLPVATTRTSTCNTDTLYAFPFVTGRNITATGLAIEHLGAAGRVWRMGFSEADTNGMPGTLIDSTTVSLTGAAIVAGAFGSPRSWSASKAYFLWVLTDGGPSMARHTANTAVRNLALDEASFVSLLQVLAVARSTALGLPASWPSGSAGVSLTNWPAVGVY